MNAEWGRQNRVSRELYETFSKFLCRLSDIYTFYSFLNSVMIIINYGVCWITQHISILCLKLYDSNNSNLYSVAQHYKNKCSNIIFKFGISDWQFTLWCVISPYLQSSSFYVGFIQNLISIKHIKTPVLIFYLFFKILRLLWKVDKKRF